MRQELVTNWMTSEVVTVAPEMRLSEAHRLMMDNKIRRLPVVKNDRLVGIVTRGDVREAEPSDATSLTIWEINYLFAKLRVKDVMARKPVAVTPDTTIVSVAQMMLERKISGLPVVEGEKVVGIITESDIFRLVVQAWGNAE